jgi:hypothetical protein
MFEFSNTCAFNFALLFCFIQSTVFDISTSIRLIIKLLIFGLLVFVFPQDPLVDLVGGSHLFLVEVITV